MMKPTKGNDESREQEGRGWGKGKMNPKKGVMKQEKGRDEDRERER